jgi:hypothetical protein
MMDRFETKQSGKISAGNSFDKWFATRFTTI